MNSECLRRFKPNSGGRVIGSSSDCRRMRRGDRVNTDFRRRLLRNPLLGRCDAHASSYDDVSIILRSRVVELTSPLSSLGVSICDAPEMDMLNPSESAAMEEMPLAVFFLSTCTEAREV